MPDCSDQKPLCQQPPDDSQVYKISQKKNTNALWLHGGRFDLRSVELTG